MPRKSLLGPGDLPPVLGSRSVAANPRRPRCGHAFQHALDADRRTGRLWKLKVAFESYGRFQTRWQQSDLDRAAEVARQGFDQAGSKTIPFLARRRLAHGFAPYQRRILAGAG